MDRLTTKRSIQRIVNRQDICAGILNVVSRLDDSFLGSGFPSVISPPLDAKRRNVRVKFQAVKVLSLSAAQPGQSAVTAAQPSEWQQATMPAPCPSCFFRLRAG